MVLLCGVWLGVTCFGAVFSSCAHMSFDLRSCGVLGGVLYLVALVCCIIVVILV